MLLLLFSIGAHRCGIDARWVVEVVPAVELDPVRDSYGGSCGGVVRRGEYLPVYDLEQMLGSGQSSKNLGRRIIFVSASLDSGAPAAGLLAGGVTEAARVQEAGIVRAPFEQLGTMPAASSVFLLQVRDILERCDYPNL